MTKKAYNTSKGRKSLPHKPAIYNLKDREGNTVYTGHTKDVNQRIKQHHQNPDKHFSSITFTLTKTKKDAQKKEKKRLLHSKPPLNRQR